MDIATQQAMPAITSSACSRAGEAGIGAGRVVTGAVPVPIATRPLSARISGSMVTTQNAPVSRKAWRQPASATAHCRIGGQTVPAR